MEGTSAVYQSCAVESRQRIKQTFGGEILESADRHFYVVGGGPTSAAFFRPGSAPLGGNFWEHLARRSPFSGPNFPAEEFSRTWAEPCPIRRAPQCACSAVRQILSIISAQPWFTAQPKIQIQAELGGSTCRQPFFRPGNPSMSGSGRSILSQLVAGGHPILLLLVVGWPPNFSLLVHGWAAAQICHYWLGAAAHFCHYKL